MLESLNSALGLFASGILAPSLNRFFRNHGCMGDRAMVEQNGERTEWVLVVDDDLANLSTAGDLLETMKLGVMAATSGEEALRKVAQHAPDLILLDVMMPGMDGYEVCRRLKAHNETKT